LFSDVCLGTLEFGAQGFPGLYLNSQLLLCRAGFNEGFPLMSLNCFYEDEIEHMLCGMGEKWTVDMLTDSIKFDHGYACYSS
jgi:hypothetical protein